MEMVKSILMYTCLAVALIFSIATVCIGHQVGNVQTTESHDLDINDITPLEIFEIDKLLIFTAKEDPNDPSVCLHNELVAKDKNEYWVMRLGNDSNGSLFHRTYLCPTCKSEILITVATRISNEKEKK